jgi:hypothetical protein
MVSISRIPTRPKLTERARAVVELGLSSAANRQVDQMTRIPEGVVSATLRKAFGKPGV